MKFKLTLSVLFLSLVAQGINIIPPGNLRGDTVTKFWEQMKTKLPGKWDAQMSKGKTVHVTYTLISDGTALMETFITSAGKQTATVYYPIENSLALTHYCAQGNQPRLAITSIVGDEATFTFLDVVNLTDKQSLMKELRIGFPKPNLFEQTSIYIDPKGQAEKTTLHFTRKN